MTEANKAIRRVHHVIPTVDDLKYDVNGATVFSKIDLNKGYHQLELSPESRNITTFSTHAGLARFRRLNFGTNSASEIFHEEIRRKLQNIQGAVNIHDDILIFGHTQELHDAALKKVLEMLSSNKLTINVNKCEYSRETIKFYGLIFSKSGVSPDPEKVEALKICEPPVNKSELRSFLGMTNFSASFIENYAQKTAKLRELLQNNIRWKWTNEHQRDFVTLTGSLVENCMLEYFDSSLETEIICDGSPLGLGCILTQIDKSTGTRKVIQYASRSLTPPESKYSQIEREAMSIFFGCMKFRTYLLGKPFKVITDHQPLVSMLNKPRSQMPYRVERVRLKLQGFDFTVEHMPGKLNPSDYVSRHPDSIIGDDIVFSQLFEGHVHSIIGRALEDAVGITDIRNAIEKSEILSKLKDSIHRGYIHHHDKLLKPYVKIFRQLSLYKDVIIKGSRILIPEIFVNDVIKSAHEGHQGIIKTKQLLRTRVWFPGMDVKVENFVSNCRGCQASVLENNTEPLKMTELPDGPWQNVASDLHGPTPSGDYVLVVIDEYSRFPEVEFVKSTSPRSVIPKLDKIFSSFGIPLKIRSDNGSPYNSLEFQNYVKYMGIAHKPITPMYPKANGLVENFNRMIEKVIHTSAVEGMNWKQELFKFLRNYRATAHVTTGRAPADLCFQKRTFRVRVPEIIINPSDDSDIRERDKCQKDKIKYYADRKSTVKPCEIQIGDTVLVKQKRTKKRMPYYDSTPYNVISRKGNMITASRPDHRITRNSSFFKKIPTSNLVFGNIDDDSVLPSDDDMVLPSLPNNNAVEVDNVRSTPRCSSRVKGAPVRFPMDVLY